jgi:transcriptional regulator with XRE-family HTH domain
MTQLHIATPSDADREFERLVEQERLIDESVETIVRLMIEKAVTRTELASRIGRSKSYVSQVLSGSRNMTLRTVSDMAFALGRRVRFFDEALVAIDVPQAHVASELDLYKSFLVSTATSPAVNSLLVLGALGCVLGTLDERSTHTRSPVADGQVLPVAVANTGSAWQQPGPPTPAYAA